VRHFVGSAGGSFSRKRMTGSARATLVRLTVDDPSLVYSLG
jgi:hypothetical protein